MVNADDGPPQSVRFLSDLDRTFPVEEMALSGQNVNPGMFNDSTEKKSDQKLDGDIEDHAAGPSRWKRFHDTKPKARIAPVLPHLAGYDFGSDDSGSDILGQQIALEADNAIQYRTCSWYKVRELSMSKPAHLPFYVQFYMSAPKT